MDHLRFVPARGNDGPAMQDLARQSFGKYVDRIGREPAPMLIDYDALAASGSTWLAWAGDELVGMVTLGWTADAMTINNVAVAPSVQGVGLGSWLLSHAEQIAQMAGAPRVTLFTNAAMTENIGFYTRRGYEEVDRRTEDGYDRVYFVKELQ